MTPWPLSVEMDAAELVNVFYYHVDSTATPIRSIRADTEDLFTDLVSSRRLRARAADFFEIGNTFFS